jgi:prophage regulatory protein
MLWCVFFDHEFSWRIPKLFIWNFAMKNHDQLLGRKQIEERLNLSRSTLYALLARGQFPKPIHLTTKKVAWMESDIEQWILERKSKSDSEAA